MKGICNMKKKVISLLLAALMVVSLLPVTAFAEGETIADILPDVFPTDKFTAWVCRSLFFSTSGVQFSEL